MKHLYLVTSILFALFFVACMDDTKEEATTNQPPVPVSNAANPSPKTVANVVVENEKPTVIKQDTSKSPDVEATKETITNEVSEEDAHPYRDISVGKITSACDLISEAEIREKVPGFKNVAQLNMIPRNSPDNHSSACECRAVNDNKVFIVGYRKNPANLQYIDQIIAEGEIREYSANIPPYEPVQGLGLKAAFNRKHGYMKWVGDNGVLVYAYVFPTNVQNVDMYEPVLYKMGQEIDDRFHGR